MPHYKKHMKAIGKGQDQHAISNVDWVDIRRVVENAWGIYTTYTPESWTLSNAAKGQCGSTTELLVQLFPEMERMKGWACGDSGSLSKPQPFRVRHYWVKLWGIDIDWTWKQFPPFTVLQEVEPASFEDVVANEWMAERCQHLWVEFELIASRPPLPIIPPVDKDPLKFAADMFVYQEEMREYREKENRRYKEAQDKIVRRL